MTDTESKVRARKKVVRITPAKTAPKAVVKTKSPASTEAGAIDKTKIEPKRPKMDPYYPIKILRDVREKLENVKYIEDPLALEVSVEIYRAAWFLEKSPDCTECFFAAEEWSTHNIKPSRKKLLLAATKFAIGLDSPSLDGRAQKFRRLLGRFWDQDVQPRDIEGRVHALQLEDAATAREDKRLKNLKLSFGKGQLVELFNQALQKASANDKMVIILGITETDNPTQGCELLAYGSDAPGFGFEVSPAFAEMVAQAS